MPRDAGTRIYMYHKKLELDSSTSLLVEVLLKSKHMIQSCDIPLSENILHDDLLHNLLGMCAAAHCDQGLWTVWVNSS